MGRIGESYHKQRLEKNLNKISRRNLDETDFFMSIEVWKNAGKLYHRHKQQLEKNRNFLAKDTIAVLPPNG